MVVCQLLGVRPDLTVSHDIPFKPGKCRHYFTESCCWYSDFEIVVFAGGVAGVGVDRRDRRHPGPFTAAMHAHL